MNRKFLKYGFLLLIPLVAAVFLRVVWFDVLPLDDRVFLKLPEWSPAGLWQAWMEPVLQLHTPLVTQSLMLDRLLWQGNLFGYHVGNLIFHILNVLLVYTLARELGMRRSWALIAASIWAFSPQRVESVAWIAERKDVLLGSCFLGGLAGALAGLRCHQAGWVFGGMLLGTLSICSKPTGAFFLPVLALLLWMTRQPKKNWLFTAKYAWIALIGPLLYFTRGGQTHDQNFLKYLQEDPWYFTLARGLSNYAEYFWKTFFPVELNPIYPTFCYQPSVWLWISGTVVIVLSGLWMLWQKVPGWTVRWIFPLILLWGFLLGPVAGFFIYGNMTFADRNNYLPGVFLTFAVVWVAGVFLSGRVFRRIAVVYVLLLAIGSFLYLPAFQNEETYYTRCVLGKRANFRMGAAAAFYRIRQNRLDEAEMMAPKIGPFAGMDRKTLEDTILYRHFLNGVMAYHRRDWREAAIQINPILSAPNLYHLRGVSHGALRLVFSIAMEITARNGNSRGTELLRRKLAECDSAEDHETDERK